MVVSSALFPLFEDIAVRGFSSRIAPIRRTTSDHEMVCMSAWRYICICVKDKCLVMYENLRQEF